MRIDHSLLIRNKPHLLQGAGGFLLAMGGLGLMWVAGSLSAWRGFGFWAYPKAWPLLVLCSLAYLISILVLRQFQRLPRARTVVLIFVTATLIFAAVIVVIALGRFYYSRSFLLAAYLTTLGCLLLAFELLVHSRPLRLAIVPGGMSTTLLANVPKVDWFVLDKPELTVAVDGLVVDWHEKLCADWLRFLSNCSLRRLPVFHAAVIFETVSGKISLDHLSEGLSDQFHLPPLYSVFKRIADVAVVLLLAPIALPLAIFIAMGIRLDSKGAALYWQERVGQGGNPFRICKFRSMRLDSDNSPACFAVNADRRITRFGRVIRLFRFDEIPQFWNVLKGEMSLIGPRPEQVPFVAMFEKEIPYYTYRHLVKPGITGWAQVNHGYAAATAETIGKLEYDLYYIKYFSFWLDILIVFKTIRVILTGDGAR